MFGDLRPVDAVMFLFYLVLLALAVVADLRDAIWFVPARPLGGVRDPLVRRSPAARDLVLGRTGSTATRDDGPRCEAPPPHLRLRQHGFLLVLLALQGWPGLVVWVILIPVQVIRARREERVLAEAFGAEYEAYRSSTWF